MKETNSDLFDGYTGSFDTLEDINKAIDFAIEKSNGLLNVKKEELAVEKAIDDLNDIRRVRQDLEIKKENEKLDIKKSQYRINRKSGIETKVKSDEQIASELKGIDDKYAAEENGLNNKLIAQGKVVRAQQAESVAAKGSLQTEKKTTKEYKKQAKVLSEMDKLINRRAFYEEKLSFNQSRYDRFIEAGDYASADRVSRESLEYFEKMGEILDRQIELQTIGDGSGTTASISPALTRNANQAEVAVNQATAALNNFNASVNAPVAPSANTTIATVTQDIANLNDELDRTPMSTFDFSTLANLGFTTSGYRASSNTNLRSGAQLEFFMDGFNEELIQELLTKFGQPLIDDFTSKNKSVGRAKTGITLSLIHI